MIDYSLPYEQQMNIPSLQVDELYIKVTSKPDFRGNRSFTIFWRTDYIPGHPNGDYKPDYSHCRAQCYRTRLDTFLTHYRDRQADYKITVKEAF